jgi:glucokinase
MKVVLGIDIGGTNTVFGFTDKEGAILYEGKIKSKGYQNIESYIELLSKKIKSVLQYELKHCELIGVGIGAPNGNYFSGSIEFAPNLEFKGVIPLVDLMKQYFDAPIVITNDANAGALGEKLYGGAKEMDDYIYITLGTGLGSGIVSNGKLLYGHDGFAGEIGHTCAISDGRLCGCGRKGCLETYASATGIVRTVFELLDRDNRNSSLRNINREKMNSFIIYQEAKKGDEIANEAFDFTARILGKSLADSVAYTSPEAIFLFGGLANAKEFIFVPVKKYLEEHVLNIYKNKVQILPSELNEGHAAILGAAALIWNEL